MSGTSTILSLRCVMFIGFDYVKGPVLLHQHPTNFVTQAEFKSLSPLLVPKPELTRRVFSYAPSNGTKILLFCPEEMKADHYERNLMRFTMCFGFETSDILGNLDPFEIYVFLRKYAAPLVTVVEALKKAETRFSYLLVHTHPTCEGAALKPLPTQVLTINNFDCRHYKQERWTPLSELVSQVFDCCASDAGPSQIVLSTTYSFHVRPAVTQDMPCPRDPEDIPHVVGVLTQEVLPRTDIALVDIMGAINGERNALEIAELLGVPVSLVVDGLHHLEIANYVRVRQKVTLDSVYKSTPAFHRVLCSPSHFARSDVVKFVHHFCCVSPSTHQKSNESNVDDGTVTPPFLEQSLEGSFPALRRMSSGPPKVVKHPDQAEIAASMLALAKFCGGSVRSVMMAMRVSKWRDCFGGWSERAILGLATYGSIAGWLDAVKEVDVNVEATQKITDIVALKKRQNLQWQVQEESGLLKFKLYV